MLDYDAEAAIYDRTRGGEERAEAAAEAVRTLLPAGTRTLVDVACGTGIVSTRLREPGRTVIGVDLSAGMLEYARPRLDGAAIRADATQLPFADEAADAVIFMWLLHLVDMNLAEQAMSEAARVLRPGGVVIATIDKTFAMYGVPSDLSAAVEPIHRAQTPEKPDTPTTFTKLGQLHGLEPGKESTYTGHGHGWSPHHLLRSLPTLTWYQQLDQATASDLRTRVAALPDQDQPRPDPVYRVACLHKSASTAV